MTRLEEYRMIIDEIAKKMKYNSFETYEEKATFQLTVIAIMLTDISKSLATLVDKVEREK